MSAVKMQLDVTQNSDSFNNINFILLLTAKKEDGDHWFSTRIRIYHDSLNSDQAMSELVTFLSWNKEIMTEEMHEFLVNVVVASVKNKVNMPSIELIVCKQEGLIELAVKFA